MTCKHKINWKDYWLGWLVGVIGSFLGIIVVSILFSLLSGS